MPQEHRRNPPTPGHRGKSPSILARASTLARAATSLIAPPLCVACRCPCASDEVVCPRCRRALERCPAPEPVLGGIDRARAATRYEGVARQLVIALKFGGLRPLAAVAAELVAERAAEILGGGPTIVAVPPAPLRAAWRGHDPAAEIAAALGVRTGLPVAEPLSRDDLRRQRGGGRARRIASPPRVSGICAAPEHAVLVDDVVTTGATLTACALALWDAGSARIDAVAFAAATSRSRS